MIWEAQGTLQLVQRVGRHDCFDGEAYREKWLCPGIWLPACRGNKGTGMLGEMMCVWTLGI